MQSGKIFIEQQLGFYESIESTLRTDSIIRETFLQRLLIKKVQIGSNIGNGGAISSVDQILYVITNKGKIMAFDINNFTSLHVEIEDVPMNLKEFNLSFHPFVNDFRMPWFRVNGFYPEITSTTSHRLFVSHNSYNRQADCITHNISRIDLETDGTNVRSNQGWVTIFTAEPCINPEPENWLAVAPYSGHISGGNIVEFDSNSLLVSVGDYNHHGLNNTPSFAMDELNPYGKLILVNKNSGKWSIFSKGHRNAAGLFIDNNGTIWSTENGPMGGDELNIIKRGENYGWPLVSLGIWYNSSFDLEGGAERGFHPGYAEPVFSWAESIAPGNLIGIQGDKFKSWRGDLLIGTRRDQSLRRLRINESGQILYDERIELGHRIRDITTLPDDTIVLFTDDGYLIFIDDGGPVFNEMNTLELERVASLEKYDLLTAAFLADRNDRMHFTSHLDIYEYKCASCHNLDSNYIGPKLGNIFEKSVGKSEDFKYTEALQNDSREWTPSLLRSFLMNADDEFAGTRMPAINLTNAEVDSIIKFLQ